jgi:hypothetical protein
VVVVLDGMTVVCEEGLRCNPGSSTTTKAKQRGIARRVAVVEDAGWMQREAGAVRVRRVLFNSIAMRG